MDRLTKERRSWNMGRIRSRDTGPEVAVRAALHDLGFRFRLHVKALPGKPDIVLRKWKHIIFVDGCFWHRHKGCKMAYTPKSDIERWSNKFRQNVARDKRVRQELKRLGWSISTIWQCKTEKPAVFAKTIRTLAARIRRK